MYIDYIVYIVYLSPSNEALDGFADRTKNKNSVSSSRKIGTHGIQSCALKLLADDK
jgi:hypothetical protein